jgi:hypothetical protein
MYFNILIYSYLEKVNMLILGQREKEALAHYYRA